MHKPVLLKEVLEYLAPKNGEVYVDATFGAGGYTTAILDAAECRVISIDQDPTVKNLADKISSHYQNRFQFIAGNFGTLENLIQEKVDGIVFDIGVSSMHIDNAERGFSFQKEGPLDMRMSLNGETAADFLNSSAEKTIADVIYKYGDEKASRRIAKEIISARPLATTKQLVEIIHKVKGSGKKIDSATQTFQAIRIFINRELEVLESGLAAAIKLLKDGGRLVVVTFHSLEDRIVKSFFRENSNHNINTNRHQFFDDFEANKKNEKKLQFALEIITKKAIVPKEDEIMSNSRARSAKLRAATKLGA